ncbi:MAG: hypothetical protein QW292_04705 [Candidatus Parvarchaeota archaeon]
MKNVLNIAFLNMNGPYIDNFILIATLIAIVRGIPIPLFERWYIKGMCTDL